MTEVKGTPPPPALVAQFLAAVREQRDADAARVLQEAPTLVEHDARVAVVLGDLGRVEAALAADPTWATRPQGPEGWSPLIYAAASFIHRLGPAIEGMLVRVTQRLLAAGASPDSFVCWVPGDDSVPLSALSFAASRGSVGVTRALLDAGADPNDGESLYHAAEHDHRECLRLLVAHGAFVSAAHPRYGNTPLYFLAGHVEGSPVAMTAERGMRWLLEQGADPNVPSGPRGETPLHARTRAGCHGGVCDLLLAHGAAIDAARADGVTPLGLAVRLGRPAAAAFLRERGADEARVKPMDRFLGACLAGDEAAARATLGSEAGLLESLEPECGEALAQAASQGRASAVGLMLALGFSPGSAGGWPGTPLHHAAWHGQVECVRTLLTHGAPVNVRDERYGSSPLAWAVHGSVHATPDDVRYLAVVELLAAAGADRTHAINRWGETPSNMGNAVMTERLRRLGLAD